MECSCNFSDYNGDSDSMRLYTCSARKAAKDHKCTECGDLISKGSVYIYEKFLYEGKFYVYKTCPNCDNLRKVFYPTGGYPLDDLWETIYNNISSCDGEVPELCIRKLLPPVKEKICDYINKLQLNSIEDIA